MNKSVSTLLLALVSVATAGAAMAQGDAAAPATKIVQVAAINPEKPVMSHEVASLMQAMQKAQAQYRRSGQPQDLARVEAVRRELASRGFGRVTQAAPIMLAETAAPMEGDQSLRVSLAQ